MISQYEAQALFDEVKTHPIFKNKVYNVVFRVETGAQVNAYASLQPTIFNKNEAVTINSEVLRLRPQWIKAVLAHELAHIYHRHPVRSASAKHLLSFLLGAGSIVGGTLIHPIYFVILIVIPILNYFLERQLAREFEFQADKAAAQVTSPADVISLFEFMAKSGDTVHTLFSSHPPFKLRISRLQK